MASEKLDEKAIFNVARRISSPEARTQYLYRACDADETLLERVRELLGAYEEQASFLESPPAERPNTAVDQSTSERPGMRIGPFKLLQQIGEGGMGVVYLAEQTQPVRRKVALKVIKPGLDSREVVARFDAEKQALALMDHVNIARVLDVGTTEPGRPYFVMELVHGVPITKYCDDHQLTPRERLELFVPVCHAIQHAHQKGIIHRDIKPTNVLITLYDGRPVPKVIDFGVAKAIDQDLTQRTLFTRHGSLVGTLEYMSPEQAEMSALGVDTRSDIYSLGVLLYELLTGVTPLSSERLKAAAYDEILRRIREEEPLKPSTRLSDSREALASISAQRHMEPIKLARLMRGELDWIVMKTLEKDRNRRYETAGGFADDVRRYLDDLPVLACPPSASYRLRKFARRRMRVLATLGAMVLALLVVAGTLGWAVRDREANAQREARERAARELAVESKVNSALDEAERWQEQGNWSEALSAVKRAEGLFGVGGGEESRDRLNGLRNDLTMAPRLDEIRLVSSEWKAGGFDFAGANRAYALAFRDYGIDVTRLSTTESAARIRARARVAVVLTAALDHWAYCRNQLKKTGGGKLMAVAQAADPDPWKRRVRVAFQQNDPEALESLAASANLARQPPASLLLLAESFRFRGRSDAELAVLRQAQRQYPGDFWINLTLAATLDSMGPSYSAEAVSFDRAALAVRPWSIAAQNNLGMTLKNCGKLEEATACFRDAIATDPAFVFAHLNLGDCLAEQKKVEEAFDCYRRAVQLQPQLPLSHHKLGFMLFQQERFDDAVASLRRAIELDPTASSQHLNLGLALDKQGKLEEAVVAYRKAIELGLKSAVAHNNLGAILRNQGLLDEAIMNFREAVEADADFVGAHRNLGIALEDQGQLDLAIDSYRRAIELEPGESVHHFDLGLALKSQGKLEEAIDCYRKAIEVDPTSSRAHNNLGNALKAQGKLDEAVTSYRRAIECDSQNILALGNLGGVLNTQGKPAEAIDCYRRCIELDPRSATAHTGLGLALQTQGRKEEALACSRRAVELDPKLATAHHNLGFVLREQGGPLDVVIACYHRALELDPGLFRSYNNLGNALKDQGKLDEAIACYRQAIELEPTFSTTHHLLGFALAEQGKLDEAIAEYRETIRLSPDSVTAYSALGSALYQIGAVDDAIAAYRNALPDPATRDYIAWLLNQRAWELVLDPERQLSDSKRAVEWATESVELKPAEAAYRHTLGAAHYRAGNFHDALAMLRNSMELRGGGDSFEWFFLAMVHWRMGEKDEARMWYAKAADWMDNNAPTDGELTRFRAEAAELLGVDQQEGR